MLPVSLGLTLLIVIAAGIFKMGRKTKQREGSVDARGQLELPEGEYAPTSLGGAEAPAANIELTPAAQQLSEGDREQLADRIRQIAKRDPAATANVLRMWLQEGQAATAQAATPQSAPSQSEQ